MISLIAAMDRNRVIGVGNRLPWRLPADLQRFKALTWGHRVVMGRKTFESIGRPLPGRTNVVVTRDTAYHALGCTVLRSVDDALAGSGDEEVFVIGGAEIYAQTIDRADRLYVTAVDTQVPHGDAYFPEIDPRRWKLAEETSFLPDERHAYGYSYRTYVRRAR